MKSTFYKVYLSVIIAFVVLLTGSMVWLFSWLKGFESSQPDFIMQTVIEELSENSAERLFKKYEIVPSKYEGEKIVSNAIEQSKEGKELTYKSLGRASDEGELSYIVSADNKPLLTVNLKKEEKSTPFGAKYKLNAIELDKGFYNTVIVVAPENAQVKVNGISVEREFFKPVGVNQAVESYINKGDSIALCRGEIGGIVSEKPEVTAQINGLAAKVNLIDGIYTVEIPLTESVGDEIGQFALKAAKEYSAYMQDDSSFTAVSAFLKKGTPFYENVRTSLVIFAWNHDSFHFEGDKVQELHKYNDNFYRCRISFTQVLKLGSKEYKDSFDKYVYVERTEFGLKVVDMIEAKAE